MILIVKNVKQLKQDENHCIGRNEMKNTINLEDQLERLDRMEEIIKFNCVKL